MYLFKPWRNSRLGRRAKFFLLYNLHPNSLQALSFMNPLDASDGPHSTNTCPSHTLSSDFVDPYCAPTLIETPSSPRVVIWSWAFCTHLSTWRTVSETLSGNGDFAQLVKVFFFPAWIRTGKYLRGMSTRRSAITAFRRTSHCCNLSRPKRIPPPPHSHKICTYTRAHTLTHTRTCTRTFEGELNP